MFNRVTPNGIPKLPAFGFQPKGPARPVTDLGAPGFLSKQAHRRLLPSERAGRQSAIAATGIPVADYNAQQQEQFSDFSDRRARRLPTVADRGAAMQCEIGDSTEELPEWHCQTISAITSPGLARDCGLTPQGRRRRNGDRFIFDSGRLVGYRDPDTGEEHRFNRPDAAPPKPTRIQQNMPESAPTARGGSLQRVEDGSFSEAVMRYETGQTDTRPPTMRPQADVLANKGLTGRYGPEDREAVEDLQTLFRQTDEAGAHFPMERPEPTTPAIPEREPSGYERTKGFFDKNVWGHVGSAVDRLVEAEKNAPAGPLRSAIQKTITDFGGPEVDLPGPVQLLDAAGRPFLTEPAAVDYREGDTLHNIEAAFNQADLIATQMGPSGVPIRAATTAARAALRTGAEIAEGAAKVPLMPLVGIGGDAGAGASRFRRADPNMANQLQQATDRYNALKAQIQGGNRDAEILRQSQEAFDNVNNIRRLIDDESRVGQMQSTLGELDPALAPDEAPQGTLLGEHTELAEGGIDDAARVQAEMRAQRQAQVDAGQQDMLGGAPEEPAATIPRELLLEWGKAAFTRQTSQPTERMRHAVQTRPPPRQR